MAYKVISDFKDLRDGGYEYKAGDIYPHTGTADAERVKHLMTPTEQRGALLEEVEDKPKKAEVVQAVEETPAEPVAKPSKRKKKEV